MADIKLSRPAAGQNVVVPSAPDARMVLDFAADQVSIDRPQGSDSLYFRFDDGSSIELQNFYTQYNKDAIPSFEVDGQLIAGADFFNAFGPDLAPAAGPSASPTRSGRYSDFANAGLEDGINHLDGLDYRLGFGGDTQPNINPYASPFLINAAPALSTGGAAIAIGLTESAWDGKSASAAPVVSQSGSFSVADPDGDSLTTTVSMGGKVVAVSTAGPTTVESDYGTLVITPKGGGSNVTFEYTYTLKQDPYSPTDSLAEGEKQADNIVFSINDGKGHTVTQPINVVITGSKDAPDISGVTDFTLKDIGNGNGVNVKGERSDTLNADENKPTQDGGTDFTQHTLSASGQIVARDPDHGDELTYGIKSVLVNNVSIAVNGHATSATGFDTAYDMDGYGTLYLNSKTGEYRFDLDSTEKSTVDKLAEGDSVKISMVPTVHDKLGVSDKDSGTTREGGGAFGGETIDITIHGTNEAPENIAAHWTGGNTVQENGVSQISGKVEAADWDSDGADLRYGLLHTDADGKQHSEIKLYVVDDNGAMKITTVSPTDGVRGHHDGYYGELTMDPKSGEYSFTMYNDSDVVQKMGLKTDGTPESKVLLGVTLVAEDAHGAYTTTDISLKVQGANDAPVFDAGGGASYVGAVKESGVWATGEFNRKVTGGKFNGTLVADENNPTSDSNDEPGKSIPNGSTGKGYHELIATGHVHAADTDASDSLTYGLDCNGAKVLAAAGTPATVYIYQKNDGSFEQSTTAPDKNSAPSYVGKMEMNASGEYKFTLNDAKDAPANALREGAKLPLTFTPTVYDGHEYNDASHAKDISITIVGNNDNPFIAAAPVTWNKGSTLVDNGFGKGNASVSGTRAISGKVNADDYDADDKGHLSFGFHLSGNEVYQNLYVVPDGADASGKLKYSMAPSEPADGNYYAKVHMNGDGTYRITLNNNADCVNAMKQGESLTIAEVPVVVVDTHGSFAESTFNFSITGTNDKPVVVGSTITLKESGVYSNGGAPTADLVSAGTYVLESDENTTGTKLEGTEDGQHLLSAEGDISITDVDHDDNKTLHWGIKTQTGEVEIGDKSTSLVASETSSQTFYVNSDGKVVASNPVSAKLMGTLHIDNKGHYTFDLNDAADSPVNKIPESITKNYTIEVYARDATGAINTSYITVSIKGSNEAPSVDSVKWADGTVSVGSYGVITESGSVPASITGKVIGSDVDSGEAVKLTYGLVTNVADNASVHDTLYVKVGAKGPELTETAPTGSHDGYYGEVYINPSSGAYKFTLYNDSADVQSLSARTDDFKDISIPVVAIDPKGAYGNAAIDVRIRGENDATTIDTGILHQDQRIIEAGVKPKSTVTDAVAREYGDKSDGISSVSGRIHATDIDTKDQKELDNAPNTDGTKLHYVIKDSHGVPHDLNVEMNAAEDAGKSSFTIELAHGSLAIERDSAGGFKYEYTVHNNNDPVVQQMNLGSTPIRDDFTVIIRDTVHKSETPQAPVHITITGSNDRPVVSSGSTATLNLDGEDTDTATGSLTIHDAEQTKDADVDLFTSGKDGHFTFSLVKPTKSNDVYAEGDKTEIGESKFVLTSDSPVVQGDYGRLIIDQATGAYKYERTADLTSLAKGSTVTDTFYVRVKDADGAYSEIKPIVIIIQGKDDGNTLTGNTLNITEDGVTGTVQGILKWQGDGAKLGANGKQDVAASGGAVQSDGSIHGSLGWSDPDTNADAQGNALKHLAGQADSYGKDTYSYKKLTYTDAEGKTHSLSAGSADGNGYKYEIGDYGQLLVQKDGTYTFTPNGGEPSFNELAKNESVQISLVVENDNTNTNAKGIDSTLNITIHGTNDAPVVKITQGTILVNQYTDSFTGDKQSHAQFTGSISGDTAIDYLVTHQDMLLKYVEQEAKEIIDNLKKSRVAWWISLVGEDYATDALVDMANGVNGFLSTLGALDDILKLAGRADDITSFLKGQLAGHTVVVDSDETAVWSNSHGGDVVVRGMLNTKDIVSDVDHGAKLSFFALEEDSAKKPTGNVTQSIKGEYGTLVIHSDGSYQYVLDFNGQAYKDFASQHPIGGLASENFKVYVRDENNAVADKPIELVINVNAPSIDWSDSGSGRVGNLDITSIDNVKVQEDGTTFASGSVLTNHGSAQPKYDSGLCLTGKYTTIDAAGPTTSHAARNVSSIPTEYGTITLLPDGSYTYTLNNDSSVVQQLRAGDTIKQKFEITNGSVPKEITVIIAGTNDKPYLVTNSDTVALKQNPSSWDYTDPHGSFTVNDVDKGEQAQLKPSGGDHFSSTGGSIEVGGTLFTYQYSVEGSHGTFYIAKGIGSGTFDYQYVKGSDGTNYRDDVSDSAKLIVSNGKGDGNQVKEFSLSATLNYANDAPSAIKITPNVGHEGVTEDLASAMVASGRVTATDTDVTSSGAKDADSLSFSIKGDNGSGMQDYIDEQGKKLGTLIMDKNGNYEFHLNTSSPVVQQLGAGDEKHIEFTIQVSDNHDGGVSPATLPITIKGSNDAPVISLHHVTIGNNGSEVLGAAGSGEYASLTHNDISKSYTVGGELWLADADVTDKVTFTLKAGADSVVSSGTIDTALTIYAYKDGSGKWTQCSVGQTGKVEMGQLVLANTGISHSGSAAYKFVGNDDGLALINKGETLDITATITAEDYHNGNKNDTSSSAEFTVSITGTNSIPQFAAKSVSNILTDNGSTYSVSGALSATDADGDGDTLQYLIHTDSGNVDTASNKYGALTLSGNQYTFTLNDEGKYLLHSLGQGQQLDAFTFAIVARDKYRATASQDLHIGLKGINDAPVPTGETFHTSSGQLHATDPDTGDKIASYALQSDAAYGHVVVDPNGHYNYDPYIHSEQRLDALQQHLSGGGDTWASSFTDSFMFTATDNQGLKSTAGTASLAFDAAVTEKDGGHHVDITSGGETSHLLFGSNSADILDAHEETANHIIYGGGGNDILSGGSGDDILYGGTGHNELHGEGGNDTLYAGNDGDHLYGGAGNDHLYGGTNNDFLDGGANILAADHGGNHLYGGVGNDVLVFHQGDTIDGGGDLDMVIVGDGGTVDTLLRGGVNGADSNVKNVEVLVSGDKAGDITSLTDLASKGLSLSKGEDGNIHVDANHNWSVATGSHTDASNNTFTTYTHTDSNGVDLTVAVETLKNTNG